MSKNLLYIWLLVQVDLSKMLWSSSVVGEKKQLWIRVWLVVMEKYIEKCVGKITQAHIAFRITSTQSSWTWKLCGSPNPELTPNFSLVLRLIFDKSEIWPACGTDLCLHQPLTACRHPCNTTLQDRIFRD